MLTTGSQEIRRAVPADVVQVVELIRDSWDCHGNDLRRVSQVAVLCSIFHPTHSIV